MPVKQPHHKRLADLLLKDACVNKSQLLRQLLRQAESATNFNERVYECIPPHFREHVQVIGIDQTVLKLSCHNASIATRMRFETDRILKALQMRIGASKVTRIELKIRPLALRKLLTKNERSLSKKNAQLLEEVAEQTTDEKLRQALQRLANKAN